ncbi:helix-turn-helix domain-containing protein [Lactobacillus nasalidis]|uniref:helix-turn-helix domain-containing protein n=1 Tax=Lactobacillus nasalidis TaxID=2797258 RepID=UPI001916B4EB|nr:helix-turn-helix transcriptional regulator [Lactobacillus nasalidis]
MTEWNLPQLAKYTGVQIKRLREERNWSQDELAKKLNTTKTSISNYENGKRTPRFDGLYLLSTIFEVPIDTFFPEHKGANNNQGMNGNGTKPINFNSQSQEDKTATTKYRTNDLVLQQHAADSLAQISALNAQQVDQLNTIISLLQSKASRQ